MKGKKIKEKSEICPGIFRIKLQDRSPLHLQMISLKLLMKFIRIQYPENNNRRGLGFDKPLIGNDTLSLKDSYPAPEVSKSSFGHSGFTGTFVWADPEYDLVFIFLSNRVYPTRKNRNLYNLNIRPLLQQAFYQGLFGDNNIINN